MYKFQYPMGNGTLLGVSQTATRTVFQYPMGNGTEERLFIEKAIVFQYPMGNGTSDGWIETGPVCFNTLWEMEPLRMDSAYAIHPTCFNTLWEMEPVPLFDKFIYTTVSIPYGKWNQQQLVVEAIVAYKSLHVKGFSQKIYMLIT